MNMDSRSHRWFFWLVLFPCLGMWSYLGFRLWSQITASTWRQFALPYLLALWTTTVLVQAGVWFLTRRKSRKLSRPDILGVLALWLVQGAGVLCLGGSAAKMLIPANMEDRSDLLLGFFTLSQPGLLWCMHVLSRVRHEEGTAKSGPPKFWRSLGMLAGIQIAWIFGAYLLLTVGPQAFREQDFPVILALLAIGAVGFLVVQYLLVRLIHIVVLRLWRLDRRNQFHLRWIVFLALPAFGFLLNLMFHQRIGDFHAWPWWALLFLGGMAHLQRGTRWGRFWPLLVFLRASTFPFYAYFALVMAPLLPVGMLLVWALGAGLPIFAFLISFGISLKWLWRDVRILGRIGPRKFAGWLVVGAGLMVLPAVLVGALLHERIQISDALEYGAKGNGKDLDAQFSEATVRRAVKIVGLSDNTLEKQHANGNIPYLTWLYDLMVFKKNPRVGSRRNPKQIILELSRQLDLLGGQAPSNTALSSQAMPRVDNPRRPLRKTAIQFGDSGRTWVDFRTESQKNTSLGEMVFEYQLDLPEDVFVDGFRLEDVKKERSGILSAPHDLAGYELFEYASRSALWRLKYQPRTRGIRFTMDRFWTFDSQRLSIRFLHQGRSVVRWEADSAVLEGRPVMPREFPSLGMVVPADGVDTLPQATPQYHLAFVLDASVSSDANRQILADRLERALGSLPSGAGNVEIYAMGSNGKRLDPEDWRRQYLQGSWNGSFDLARAAKKILLDQWKSNSQEVVGIVAVTDRVDARLLADDLFRFRAISPAFPELWVLGQEERWGCWSLDSESHDLQWRNHPPKPNVVGQIRDAKQKIHYVALGRGAQLIPFVPDSGAKPELPEDPWGRAAAMALSHLQEDLIGVRNQDHRKFLLAKALESGVMARSLEYWAFSEPRDQVFLKDLLKALGYGIQPIPSK